MTTKRRPTSAERRRRRVDKYIEDTRRLVTDFLAKNANANDKETRAKVRAVRKLQSIMTRFDRLDRAGGVVW
jgi:hypothetical protein